MSLVPLLVNLALVDDYHHHPKLDDWVRFLDDDFGFSINPLAIV